MEPNILIDLDAPIRWQGRLWTPKKRTYSFELSVGGSSLAPANKISGFSDGPFMLQALTRVSTGAFKIKLFDGSDKAFTLGPQGGSSDYVRDACLFGTGSLPYLVDPAIVIPQNGLIAFDLLDVSTSTNLINLCFDGAILLPAD